MKLHGWTTIPSRYLQFEIIHKNKHKESIRFKLKKNFSLLSICSNINLLGILNFGMVLFKFQRTIKSKKKTWDNLTKGKTRHLGGDLKSAFYLGIGKEEEGE
jgi:hypothetical protein